MKRFYFLVMLLLLTCARSEDKPDIMDEEMFVDLYCDVVSRIDLIPFNTRSSFVDSIFSHYRVTEESFMATITYYNEDPEKWQEILDHILAELDNRVKAMEQKMSMPYDEPGDK
ncbi:DUF4296 domain-containing protein [candidate division KSB1 bacterium]|nr:DUF4296 domain-containing protein [candidate division KSB1 bacterium]